MIKKFVKYYDRLHDPVGEAYRDLIKHPIRHFKNGAGYRYYKGLPQTVSWPTGDTLPTPPETKSNKRKRAKDFNPKPAKKFKLNTSTNMPKKYVNSRKYGKKRGGKSFKGKRKYTKKKVKKESKTVYASGGLLKWGISYKKPKQAQALKQLRADVLMTRRGAWSTSGAPGVQASEVFMNPSTSQYHICSRTDLINFYETGAKRFFTTTNTAGVETGSAWEIHKGDNTVNILTDRSGKRIYLENIKSWINMSNQGPTSMEYIIYFLVSKNSEKTFIKPETAWQTGYTSGAKNEPVVMSKNTINAKPTQSRDFNFAWTVVKKVVGKLDPGSEQKISLSFSPKRFVDVDYFNQYEMIKGVTLVPMLVIKGVAASSGEGGFGGWAQGNDTCTTSRVKVNGVYTNAYRGYICDTWGAARKDIQGTPFATPPINDATGVYSIADAAGTVVNSNVDANFA